MEKANQPNLLLRSVSFLKRHPIFSNLLLIIVVGFALLWGALIALDAWTDHGVYEVVPDIKGMSYKQAVTALESAGLVPELSDSLYDGSHAPGTVLDQSPRARTKVKPHRTVYLTITAFTPKLIAMPAVTDMSLRQAQTTLEGVGLRNVSIVTVASEYKDLVIGVKFKGMPLQPGARIPASAAITLEVGEGATLDADSLAAADGSDYSTLVLD